MKKQELQKILKPLIKECIREVVFEEGVLSGLIREVATGLNSQPLVTETQEAPPKSQEFARKRQIELQEESRSAMEAKKRKLEESLGGGFGGIFDNVEPLSKGGTVSESKTQGPLSGYAPTDAGVDISAIMSLGGARIWKNMN